MHPPMYTYIEVKHLLEFVHHVDYSRSVVVVMCSS